MGLFGDRDLKALDNEILAMKLALNLRDQASDSAKFERGLKQGAADIATLIDRLTAKGKRDEAIAMLDTVGPRKMSVEAQSSFDQIRVEIEAKTDGG